VTTATRWEGLPDLPTVGDFVPGYEATTWFGVGAPKGFGQNRRIESAPGSELVALPSMAAVTPRAGMMLHCGK
jgi:hypothetical protein